MYAQQYRNDDPYWQTLEKQPQLDDKLSVISRLAELYLQLNHFDQLLERLQVAARALARGKIDVADKRDKRGEAAALHDLAARER